MTLTSLNVLRAMTVHHPIDSKISITADAFFSTLGWLNSNPLPTIFSMASSDLATLLPLFTYDLKYHHHRMFYNGRTLLSFWYDNSVMICGSNRFTISEIPNERLEGIDRSSFTPILEKADLQKLCEISSEGLKAIARKMGESTCKLFLSPLIIHHS